MNILMNISSVNRQHDVEKLLISMDTFSSGLSQKKWPQVNLLSSTIRQKKMIKSKTLMLVCVMAVVSFYSCSFADEERVSNQDNVPSPSEKIIRQNHFPWEKAAMTLPLEVILHHTKKELTVDFGTCLLYTSPSPRD